MNRRSQSARPAAISNVIFGNVRASSKQLVHRCQCEPGTQGQSRGHSSKHHSGGLRTRRGGQELLSAHPRSSRRCIQAKNKTRLCSAKDQVENGQAEPRLHDDVQCVGSVSAAPSKTSVSVYLTCGIIEHVVIIHPCIHGEQRHGRAVDA